MTGLMCVSLWQPWASLVALGVKSIETRSWPTKVRGRIGIHAAKRKPIPAVIGDYEVYAADPPGKVHPNHTRERPTRLYRNGSGDLRLGGSWCPLPLGAIVATANLVDCLPIIEDDTGPRCVLPHFAVSSRCYGFLFPAEMPDLGWYPPEDEPVDRNDQIPYGDFTPGRWAWLLDDVMPTEARCPWCRGRRCDPAYGHAGERERNPDLKEWRSFWGPMPRCPVCEGEGKCRPVPATGRQGFWRWEP